MTGIVVNELVTKFTARYDRTFAQYERKLNQMDKMGAKMGAKAGHSFASSFERANARVGARMSAALKGLQRQANGIKINPAIRISGASQAIRQVREVRSEMEKLNKGIGSISLGGAITGGLAALGVGKVAGFGFNAAKEYENSMMRLRTLMGDSGARNSYSALQKFAAVTPYELPEVVDMFTRLQGAGYNIADRKTGKIDMSILTRLGDLASTSNKPLAELVDAMLSSGRGLGAMVDNFIGLGARSLGDGKLAATITDIKTGKVKEMELDSTNKQQMLDFWLAGGARQGVAGGMGNLAKTLEGQMSTLTDTGKNLFAKMWLGMEKPVHKFLDQLIKGLDKMEPKFRAIGVQVGLGLRKVPAIVQAISKWAPIAAAGIGLMGVKIIGLKTIAAAEMVSRIAFEMRVLGTSAWFANAAIGFIPGLITIAAVAVAAFAADTINYFQTGESVLLSFTEKWPWLNESIKTTMENAIAGFLSLYDGISKGIDYYMPSLVKAFYFWKDSIMDVWDTIGPFFQFVLDKLGPIGQAASAIGGAFGAWGGGDGDQSTSSILGPGLVKNNNIAKIMTDIGPTIWKTRSLCLQAVWDMQNAALKGTSRLTVGHAYLGAEKLAQDKRFKEVRFTPDMYKKMMAGDRELKNLMHGATVIYNRNSGFSTESGHAEIWDTVKNKSYYGKRATSMVRSDQMINNARFFVPVQGATQQTVRMGGGSVSAPVVNNHITVNANSQTNGRDIARQTQKAATDGTSKALTKANSRFSRPVAE